jgi:hypothetical protein
MAGTIGEGALVAYVGPSVENGPESGKIGRLNKFVPRPDGFNDFEVIFESDGTVFKAPASSWQEVSEYKSAQTKKWTIIGILMLAAAGGGYWWWKHKESK